MPRPPTPTQNAQAQHTHTHTHTHAHQRAHPHTHNNIPTHRHMRGAQQPVGGMDSYGCYPSSGYVWCAELSECVRPWETTCASLSNTGADGTTTVPAGQIDTATIVRASQALAVLRAFFVPRARAGARARASQGQCMQR
jgi:hypothetical protein